RAIPLPALEADVPVLDLHRWHDMDLHADQAIGRTVRRIGVDAHGHEAAVEDVCQDVAAGDDVDGVPVVGDELGKRVRVTKGRGDDRRTTADDMSNLPPGGHDEPS